MMKKFVIIAFLFVFVCCVQNTSSAQGCSICTKTAQQLGEKPAKGMNTGIIYLAFAPLALIGVIGFRWWKENKHTI